MARAVMLRKHSRKRMAALPRNEPLMNTDWYSSAAMERSDRKCALQILIAGDLCDPMFRSFFASVPECPPVIPTPRSE